MKATGPEELERFRESAARHFLQWMHGDEDEDHAAAVLFNINGVEYVKGRLEPEKELLTTRCHSTWNSWHCTHAAGHLGNHEATDGYGYIDAAWVNI